jgi:hypothetical protein
MVLEAAKILTERASEEQAGDRRTMRLEGEPPENQAFAAFFSDLICCPQQISS